MNCITLVQCLQVWPFSVISKRGECILYTLESCLFFKVKVKHRSRNCQRYIFCKVNACVFVCVEEASSHFKRKRTVRGRVNE